MEFYVSVPVQVLVNMHSPLPRVPVDLPGAALEGTHVLGPHPPLHDLAGALGDWNQTVLQLTVELLTNQWMEASSVFPSVTALLK